MGQVVARCGFRCDACMAYVGNNHSNDDQVKVAAAWSKYFGLNIAPEKLHCNGCWGEQCAGKDLPDPSCPIRACVMERGMNTCADCYDYPCEKMESKMNGVEEVIRQFKGKITHEEFDTYMAPYDARKTLEEMRDRRVDRID
ncbi:MAG: DUF3795 domain-containing protein [Bacteroidetes bacterium]|nr:DUF3795 domain-containing protein [Bacteroidota bacterium]